PRKTETIVYAFTAASKMVVVLSAMLVVAALVPAVQDSRNFFMRVGTPPPPTPFTLCGEVKMKESGQTSLQLPSINEQITLSHQQQQVNIPIASHANSGPTPSPTPNPNTRRLTPNLPCRDLLTGNFDP
ncbi:hypothetical protein M8C21_008434, partial [Ambrosia artemisiifolia]